MAQGSTEIEGRRFSQNTAFKIDDQIGYGWRKTNESVLSWSNVEYKKLIL